MLAPSFDIDPEVEAAGCRALWCAVIELAIADAAATRFCQKGGSGTPQVDHDDAIKFLFAESGPWARSREEVCSLAGVDPDALVQRLKTTPPAEAICRRRASKRDVTTLSPSAVESPLARGVRK
jgi:hypothetical protein